jgi:hypothetical protein
MYEKHFLNHSSISVEENWIELPTPDEPVGHMVPKITEPQYWQSDRVYPHFDPSNHYSQSSLNIAEIICFVGMFAKNRNRKTLRGAIYFPLRNAGMLVCIMYNILISPN